MQIQTNKYIFKNLIKKIVRWGQGFVHQLIPPDLVFTYALVYFLKVLWSQNQQMK
jgi:hypothetical protein